VDVALRSFVKMQQQFQGARRQWAENDPETDRPATVAELFSSDQEGRFYRQLLFGMLLRMLEGEVAVGNGTPAIRKHLAEARASFERRARALDADLNVRAVPIRKLGAVQLWAILAAQELAGSRRSRERRAPSAEGARRYADRGRPLDSLFRGSTSTRGEIYFESRGWGGSSVTGIRPVTT
jgi:hypothetical protein